LMQTHLFIVSLRCCAFWVLLRNLFPFPVCSSAFPTTSCSCFKVLGLVLRSLIHFELIWVQRKRQGSSFSLLHVDIQFSQQHLLNRLSFLHHVFWVPLLKISCPSFMGLIWVFYSNPLVFLSVFVPIPYIFVVIAL
jgi:hypothetical protein